MRTAIAVTAALLTLGAAASAETERTAEVHYTPSQLVHADGRQEVRLDLRRAARAVCDLPGAFDSDTRRAERACAEAAFDAALSQFEYRVAEADGDAGTIRIAISID